MKFFFDESGTFQLPANGEDGIGIVCGIAVPESDEAEIYRLFDKFMSTLPASAFKNGEPKGGKLDEESRRSFAHLIAELPGILVCPTMLDLVSLVGTPQADGVGTLVRRLSAMLPSFVHASMRNEMAAFIDEVRKLSSSQALRLVTWAIAIQRSIADSIIAHSSEEYRSDWSSLHFEVDRVAELAGNREERVFETLLLGWLAGWSRRRPFILIEEIHTPEHPLVQNWDGDASLDLGKMIRNNLHYAASEHSKGIQLADMTSTIVRRATLGRKGVVSIHDMQNYGTMMTRSLGQAEHACGLFCLANVEVRDAERRFHGLVDAIKSARDKEPGAILRR